MHVVPFVRESGYTILVGQSEEFDMSGQDRDFFHEGEETHG